MNTKRIKPIKRFLDKVLKTQTCWIWQASYNHRGYGYFFDGDRNQLAHRWAYFYFNKKTYNNMFICHSCDTPSCVNPKHLFEGTNRDNVMDAVKKQRQKRSLSNKKVVEIRKLHSKGVLQKDLAKMFGVHFGTISHVIRGTTWRHVKDEALAKIQGMK